MHTTSGGSVGRVIYFAFLKEFAVYYLVTEEQAVAAAVGVKRQMPISENGAYKNGYVFFFIILYIKKTLSRS